MIEFREGAVCYANGRQWFFGDVVKPYKLVSNMFGPSLESFQGVLDFDDFKLNEPREGWYIPKSELDTEGKYNKAVEVFGLFGFKPYKDESFKNFNAPWDNISVSNGRIAQHGVGIKNPVKCTYDQLMAIGELKRKMVDKAKSFLQAVADDAANTKFDTPKEIEGDFNIEIDTASIERAEAVVDKNKRRNKSKQAYDILKSLGYEYDLVNQQWYKKQYI